MASQSSKHEEEKIRELAPELKSLLRTGVALTSVTQCVEELVLNALDAGATCVAVRLDLSCFKIQVVDNGCGIAADQLKKIGERYSSSKCHTVEDLDNLTYFGYRGEAVASLRDSSSVLEITSRAKHSTQTFCKLFQQGKSLPVIESNTPRPSAGTTVTVHDLFYNFPVRKKALSESIEFERIRQRIEGIALMKPSVSFTLRNNMTGNIVLQTHKTNSVLNAFTYLFGITRAKVMSEVQLTKDPFSVSGYIGKEGYSRKDLQFLYVNGRLVLKTRIHKLINNVIGKSMILKKKVGASKPSTTGDYSPSITSSPTKFSPRYAVFVINIVCPYTEYDITFEPAKTLVEFKCWNLLSSCVEEMVLSFLKKENLYVGVQPLEESTAEESKAVVLEEAEIKGDKSEESSILSGPSYAEGICTSNSKNFVTSKSVKRQMVKETTVDEEKIVSKELRSDCGININDDKVKDCPVILCTVADNAVVSDSSTDESNVPKTPNVPCPENRPDSTNIKETHLSSSDDQDETAVENEENDKEYETEDPFVKLAAIRNKGDNSKIRSEVMEEDEVPTVKSKSYIQIPTSYINHPGGSALSQFRKMSKNGHSTNKNSDKSELAASFSLKQKIAEIRKERELRYQKVAENKHNDMKCAIQFDQLEVHSSQKPTSSVRFPHTPVVSVEDKNGKMSVADTKRQDCNRNVVESGDGDVPRSKSTLPSVMLEEEINAGLPCLMDEQYTVIMNRENLLGINASVTSRLASMIQKKQLMQKMGNPEVLQSASSSRTECTEQINFRNKLDFQDGTNENHNLCPKVSRFSNCSNTAKENRSFLTTDSLVQTASQLFKNSGTRIEEQDNSKNSLSSKVAARCKTGELVESEERGQHLRVSDKRSHVSCEQNLDVTFAFQSSDKTTPIIIGEQQNKISSQTSELSTPTVLNENATLSVQQETTVSGKRFLAKDKGSTSSDEDDENADLYCYETVDSPPLYYEVKSAVAEGMPRTSDSRSFYNSSQGFIPDNSGPSSSQPKNDERVFGLLVPQSQGFETSSSGWKDEQDNIPSESQGFIPVPHFSVNRTVSPAGSEGFTPVSSDDGEHLAADSPQPVQQEQSLSDTSESSQFLTLTHFLESSSSSIADLYSEDERIEKLSHRKRKCNQVQESKQLTSDTQKIKYPKTIYHEDCTADQINSSSQSLICDINNKPLDVMSANSYSCSVISNSPSADSLDKSIDSRQICDINDCDVPYKENQQSCDRLSVINRGNTEQTCGKCAEVMPEATLHSANLILQTCQDCELSANEMCQANSFTNSDSGKEYSVYEQAPDDQHSLKGEMEVRKDIDEASSVKNNPDGGLSTQWSDVDEAELMAVDLTCDSDQSPSEKTDAVNNYRSHSEEIETTGIKETWVVATDPKTGDKLYVNQRTGNTKLSTPTWTPQTELQDSSSPEQTSDPHAANISPHSHDALVQLMEEHFEQDEEEDGLASVKWKDKRRDSADTLSIDRNVEKLFEEWENPVFECSEQGIQSPELKGPSSRGVNKAHRILNPCKFSKEMLQNLKVVGQVDKKFIACLTSSQTENLAGEPDLMVLFDQHAVHERVRLERLTSEAYEEENGQPTQFIRKYDISPAHCLQLSNEEVRIVLSFRTEFQRIGVECTENKASRGSIFIHTIPACMMEMDYKVKKMRDSVAWWLVEALIQEHVELLQTTGGSTGRLPQTLHKCLCSQACYGAIKFGEKLSVTQCEKLLDSLSKCKLPFQCAHGRPSVTPLLHMDKVQKSVVTRRPSLWKISRHVQPK